MREIMSPNVKYIKRLGTEIQNYFQSVRLHDKGIIEIDTVAPDDFGKAYKEKMIRVVEWAFRDYETAGQLYPVTVTGLKTDDVSPVGSNRFCAWDAQFAEQLTNLINRTHAIETVEMDGAFWNFDSVSKYFRFMRYIAGGQHFPHYDSDFRTRKYQTKYSLVMYFSDCETGELAFVHGDDPDRKDWSRQAREDEIFLKIKPRVGKVVLFPHDVCHTVLPYTETGVRRMARGDLIFTPETYL